jgi:GNAT superfamily N-acetyltransferase
MSTFARNAAGIDEEYRRGLEIFFPGAWDEPTYRWFLKRPFRSREPDAISAHRDLRVVGGVGINYRQVRSPDGAMHDVGVLTAAWTLPKYQGRGCFRRLVDAAIRVAGDGGCEALLSFVVQRSASALGLRRIGAASVPTRYLTLEPTAEFVPPAQLPTVRALLAEGLADVPSCDPGISFHYASADEWTAQFVDRPNRTTLYSIDGAFAVVEHVGATDRLQMLHASPSLQAPALVAMAARAHAAGRQFFYFTTDEKLADRAVALGLRQTPGAIMLLDLRRDTRALDGAASWTTAAWRVQPGDRM